MYPWSQFWSQFTLTGEARQRPANAVTYTDVKAFFAMYPGIPPGAPS